MTLTLFETIYLLLMVALVILAFLAYKRNEK